MGGSPGNAELIEFDSYADVHEFAQIRRKRKLGHNTWLIEHPGVMRYEIRYHRTNVVVYRPGVTSLFSGDYRTMTTKARLNAYLPSGEWNRVEGEWVGLRADVWTQCGEWYLTVKLVGGEVRTYEFIEGISLHADGCVTASWDGMAAAMPADPAADKRAYNRAAYRRRKAVKAAWDADAGPREERLRLRAEAHERWKAEQAVERSRLAQDREIVRSYEAIAHGRAAATGTHQEKKDELERRIDTVLAECSSKVPMYRMSK